MHTHSLSLSPSHPHAPPSSRVHPSSSQHDDAVLTRPEARIIPSALVKHPRTVLITAVGVWLVEAQVPPGAAGIHLVLLVVVVATVGRDKDLVIVVGEDHRVVFGVVCPHLPMF